MNSWPATCRKPGAKLMERSQVIAEAVRQNKAAIVFLTYRLTDGRVELRGDTGE
ncbi:carbonic anhydrase [Mycobacteroides abscessus subsp. abscessus]|nr:carbonic anhydrase [Mycobacteroides abscessus subsp. abscessus]